MFFGEAAAYDGLMGRWSAALSEPFLDWLSAPAATAWLDVGCGTGAFTCAILERSRPATVTGVDIAPALLARARATVGSRTALTVGDACALPFAGRSFDVVVAALVLNFVGEPARAVAEMSRVARRGGMLGAIVWDYPGGRSPVGVLRAALAGAGVPLVALPGSASCTLPALRSLFEHAGLVALEATAIDVVVEFGGFDDWWSGVASPAGETGRALAVLAPSARAAVREQLRSQMQLRPDGAVAASARDMPSRPW